MTEKSNGEIKIEKGVPIPTRRSNSRYPWREMQIGDSFVVASSAQAVHSSASYAHIKITTRAVDGGIRVWRVA